MNELQRDKLRVLVSDKVLVSALRSIFNEVLDESLPKVSSESDDVIGQKYRAYETSKQLIGKAFLRLEEYQAQEKQEKSSRREI